MGDLEPREEGGEAPKLEGTVEVGGGTEAAEEGAASSSTSQPAPIPGPAAAPSLPLPSRDEDGTPGGAEGGKAAIAEALGDQVPLEQVQRCCMKCYARIISGPTTHGGLRPQHSIVVCV